MSVIVSFDRWLNRNPVRGVDCMISHDEVSHHDFGSSGQKGLAVRDVIVCYTAKTCGHQPFWFETLLLLPHRGTSHDSELESLSHWLRGCSPGLGQKKAFLLQGIEHGLFSTTYPFFPGGLRAFNYCAGCRCTVNEEVLKRFQEEHQAAVRSELVEPQRIKVDLPEGSKYTGQLTRLTTRGGNS